MPAVNNPLKGLYVAVNDWRLLPVPSLGARVGCHVCIAWVHKCKLESLALRL